MSATPPVQPATLCLGQALVDLICERPIADLAQADALHPHLGGTVANVAVAAARTGARISLAGAAGDDSWGRWLRERLAWEGVDVSRFALVPAAQTEIALVAVGPDGDPAYALYGGDRVPTLADAMADRLEDAVRDSGALLIGSNSLANPAERELTMAARALALELGRPVIFEAGLRLHRWRSQADAAASANACVPDALLVRANQEEAALITGEADPERAALAILKAGAQMVVLTLGAEGAILRGELRADVDSVEAQVLSTVGAGDVLTGVLLGKLALSDFYPPVVAASLGEAIRESARACERWGALD